MNKKNNNKGCISGILGTLAIIIGVVLYTILSSLLNNLFLSLRLGDTTAAALLPLTFIGIVIAFIAFDVIFILWQFKLAKKGSDGETRANKIFKIFSIVCLSAVLIFPIVGANTFTRLDDTSISKVLIVEYKSYDIENDISRCTLACTEDGKLTYTVTMKDRESFELLGSVNSCTDQFADKYGNLYGYTVYITEKFTDKGYIVDIIGKEHMESIYKESYPEIWGYLEKIINN